MDCQMYNNARGDKYDISIRGNDASMLWFIMAIKPNKKHQSKNSKINEPKIHSPNRVRIHRWNNGKDNQRKHKLCASNICA